MTTMVEGRQTAILWDIVRWLNGIRDRIDSAWRARRSLHMAKTADFGSTAAGQIACGDVDGVDLAALGVDIGDHDHTAGGTVNNATEQLPICNVSGTAVAVLTATLQSGYGAQNEQGYGGSGSRVHNHNPGTLATGALTYGSNPSAKNDDQIIIYHTNGDIVCDLIDGVAPEVLWARYKNHYHALAGSTASYNQAAVTAYGNSGNSWFWVSRASDGSSPYWAQLHTLAGAHSHTEGSLATAAQSAGTGAGSDDAGDPKFSVAHLTGNISTRGDVNNIGIAQFKTTFDAHTHSGGTGATASGGGAAILRDVSDDFAIWALKDGVSWIRIYIDPGGHTHGGSGLSFSTPV